ncbi:hypothetical protein [Fodinibius salsisoli]|uniref:Uncharacterized protein n=1 Tax=Fodinibius salsisoli TaxID=2820877 RepID=A0ABT3PSC7_9BACT|nr:hypothetical protein [Fodinibius salsisoli]MCW9708735.1 hypothetical protein [Fodinibius salsisoli]
MEQQPPILGLCLFDHQLFYAVNQPGTDATFTRIGSYDFNADVSEMLWDESDKHFRGIQQTVKQLKDEYNIRHLRLHTMPSRECWTIVPKIVYDNADERERHIKILMSGTDRSQIQATWYTLSNQEYKFLLLRNKSFQQAAQKLAPETATTELISDFEIGSRWIQHANPGGSFMTIGCFKNCISIASFILGKLRGATYITFDDIQDLPYFWLQHTQELSWMGGLHEQTYLYGSETFHIVDILEPFWDDTGTITKMDSLEKIQVNADEATYGFSLEKAFPAMMLALDYD